MRAMFRQLFSSLTLLFSATENLASAVNRVTQLADETAASYVDEIRAERKASITTAVKALK